MHRNGKAWHSLSSHILTFAVVVMSKIWQLCRSCSDRVASCFQNWNREWMPLQQLGDMPANALLPSMKEDQHENDKVPTICDCLFENVTCLKCCAREHSEQLPQQNLVAMASQLSFEEQQSLPTNLFSGSNGFSGLACNNYNMPHNMPDHLQVHSVSVFMTLISGLQDCTNWTDLVSHSLWSWLHGLCRTRWHLWLCRLLQTSICSSSLGLLSEASREYLKLCETWKHRIVLCLLASQWLLLLLTALDYMLEHRTVRSAFCQGHTSQNMLMYVFLAQNKALEESLWQGLLSNMTYAGYRVLLL